MNKIKKTFLIVLSVILSSCLTTMDNDYGSSKSVKKEKEAKYYRATYDVKLVSVDTTNEIQNNNISNMTFEDDYINISWVVLSETFNFELENKTNRTIKIIWDESIYVDPFNSSQRIMHAGVKYSERNAPQSPSIVIRTGKISDLILPTDNVNYGSTLGWYETSLFPDFGFEGKQALIDETEDFVGKNVKILMSIEIENIIQEYIFTFDIAGVTVAPS